MTISSAPSSHCTCQLEMKLKHLESALSSVPTPVFPSPKVQLEQYPTSAHLTASVLLTALKHGDVGPGLSVLDLGCGTGMLGIGSALVGCDHVLAIDCDEDALKIAEHNVEEMELDEQVNFLLAKVNGGFGRPGVTGPRSNKGSIRGGGGNRHRGGTGKSGGRSGCPPGDEHKKSSTVTLITNGDDGIPLRNKCVDTVVTNPPFGTKHNAGIDVQFLYTATRLARRAVYSFHKSSTRDYLIRKIKKEWGMNVDLVAQMRFDIRNMYKFHKKKSVDVEVDLIRVYLPKLEEAEHVDRIAETLSPHGSNEHDVS